MYRNTRRYYNILRLLVDKTNKTNKTNLKL